MNNITIVCITTCECDYHLFSHNNSAFQSAHDDRQVDMLVTLLSHCVL